MGKYEILATISYLFNFSSFSSLIYHVYITKNTTALPINWFVGNIISQILFIIYAVLNGAWGIYIPTFFLLIGFCYLFYVKLYVTPYYPN